MYISSPFSAKRLGQTSIKLDSTITLGSSEDVSFTVESDRAALSRTGVRKWVISREYGREKQRVPAIQGLQHHPNPLEAPRQAGGEKAPCVHNEPVIGIRLPVSVRGDNHDILCILEPPLLPSEEI